MGLVQPKRLSRSQMGRYDNLLNIGTVYETLKIPMGGRMLDMMKGISYAVTDSEYSPLRDIREVWILGSWKNDEGDMVVAHMLRPRVSTATVTFNSATEHEVAGLCRRIMGSLDPLGRIRVYSPQRWGTSVQIMGEAAQIVYGYMTDKEVRAMDARLTYVNLSDSRIIVTLYSSSGVSYYKLTPATTRVISNHVRSLARQLTSSDQLILQHRLSDDNSSIKLGSYGTVQYVGKPGSAPGLYKKFRESFLSMIDNIGLGNFLSTTSVTGTFHSRA